jgi:predicted secreted hydrolase
MKTLRRAVPAVLVLWVSLASPGAQDPGWQPATPGYVFRFPADHASHPEYRIEWWYYTGNVDTATGRRFGYQVTFFRVGIVAAPRSASAWAVRDVFMTHVAISDPVGRRYRFAERLNRSGPGLAGARTDRYEVWNDDWSAQLDAAGRHVLKTATTGVAVDLVLEPGKPPAINGRDGISQKGATPGNASHYYSLTRMPTAGSLSIDGERYEVTGTSWMDHEFGTSFLEAGQQGWDWFALHLDDGTDLMLYRLRREDGSRDPHSSGTLVRPDGRAVALVAADFTLQPAGPEFRSPASGARYPVAWRLAVPREGLSLTVSTPLADQELRTGRSTGLAYWEGLVDVSGTGAGRPVRGRGYLEMTGYAGSMGRVLSRPTGAAPPAGDTSRR